MRFQPSKTVKYVCTASVLAIAACSSVIPGGRHEIARRLATPAFMVERQIPAGPFALTAFERMHERYAPANIYIEGDGLAWVSKKRRSLDPTPNNPMGLHLATRDKAKNVAYLARPCQYSRMVDPNGYCDSTYWTNKRYAPEVLDSYNAALDEIKRRYDIDGFNLVGFSGGGTIATLLAAQRADILSLRTVAGNLDHVTHSEYHQVSKLSGSLNPPQFAGALSRVPQYHFIGGQDKVVPPAILESYLQALGPTNCVQYKFIQEAAHDEGWVDKWPTLLQAEQPACRGPVEEQEFIPFPEEEEPVFSPRLIPSKP